MSRATAPPTPSQGRGSVRLSPGPNRPIVGLTPRPQARAVAAELERRALRSRTSHGFASVQVARMIQSGVGVPRHAFLLPDAPPAWRPPRLYGARKGPGPAVHSPCRTLACIAVEVRLAMASRFSLAHRCEDVQNQAACRACGCRFARHGRSARLALDEVALYPECPDRQAAREPVQRMCSAGRHGPRWTTKESAARQRGGDRTWRAAHPQRYESMRMWRS